jgi:tetratricopeptide (TPR) repeat protein
VAGEENGMRRVRSAIWILRALSVSVFFLLAARSAGAGLKAGAQSQDTIQRIQQLLEAGNTAAAQELLSQALRESPRQGGLYNLQGVLKAQEGDFTAAESNFQQAIKLSPRLESAYLNLGHLYQEHAPKDPGARKKALDVYEELLRFAPDHLEANYQSAVLLMHDKLFAESLRRLSMLPGEAQNQSQALSVQCADYAGLGQRERANQTADQMLNRPDLSEPDVTTILPILTSRTEVALVIKLLQGLAARQLASFASLQSLGLLYESAGQLAEARQTFEAAAQLQPNSAPNLLKLARVAFEQKDYTGALGYLAHARDLEPNNAALHFLWGMTCVEQNLAEEAYQALKKAVGLDPNNAYYNYAAGAVALQREDASESIPYFQRYCELKPRDPRGRLALGTAYFDSYEVDKAEKVLATVVSDPQTAAGARYYLGRIANRKGDYAEAIRQLQMALKAYPQYADAYAELGLVHLKRKEYPQAEEALERALKISPDSYLANLNLMVLYQRTGSPKAADQVKRFEQIKEKRALRAKELLRTIQVEP